MRHQKNGGGVFVFQHQEDNRQLDSRRQSIHDFAQALMDTVVGSITGILRVVQSGVSTNWWGLACPSHCGASSFPLAVACFLLGFITCLILLTLITLWFLGFHLPPSASATASPSTTRLARYLDGSARARFRGH